MTNVYTGDDFRAKERLDVILASISKYQPNFERSRVVGFCASVQHARYMAKKFKEAGLRAETILGKTPREERESRLKAFKNGDLTFVFTVDVFSEGVDIPEINMVLFLRPTESLTVFLQQLGRGLRHAPEKDCLTVLDFVGQVHHKYRIEQKFSALLKNSRRRIDREIENDFPNLPPGCSVQLERVAREHVLKNIRENLGNLNRFVPEAIRTFEQEAGKDLTFANFIEHTELVPLEILRNKTWSEWKALAHSLVLPKTPDLKNIRKVLCQASLRTDRVFLEKLSRIPDYISSQEANRTRLDDRQLAMMHNFLWGKKGRNIGVSNYRESFQKWTLNENGVDDFREICAWRNSQNEGFLNRKISLPYPCHLRLHAAYGTGEIKAALGLSDINRQGLTGVGVMRSRELKTYIHLVTFRKEDRDFSPTTRYKDYPIDRKTLHWESQSNCTQKSKTGLNYIHFRERGYTILFFVRVQKRTYGQTQPFMFLGPAEELLSYQGNRPISMTWKLINKMPAALFEEAKTV